MGGNGTDGGGAPIDRLRAIMVRLRDPESGCPWDVQQTFATIAPYTVEEAYEVADAIARGDVADLRDELGDLLLQVVFHAQMAAEAGLFDFDDVATASADKLVRRHPHVFADAVAADGAAVKAKWEAIKAAEREEKARARAARGEPPAPPDPLTDVPLALPALSRADKLQKRAARFGFDWPADEGGASTVRAKILEEIEEFHDLLAAGPGAADAAAGEFGDLLFALVNLARRAGIDAEAALRATNDKFTRRLRWMAQHAETKGQSLDGMDLAALDELWEAAKRTERAGD